MHDDLIRRLMFFLLCACALLLVSMPAHAEGVEPDPEAVEVMGVALEDALPVLAVIGAALVGVGLTRGRG